MALFYLGLIPHRIQHSLFLKMKKGSLWLTCIICSCFLYSWLSVLQFSSHFSICSSDVLNSGLDTVSFDFVKINSVSTSFIYGTLRCCIKCLSMFDISPYMLLNHLCFFKRQRSTSKSRLLSAWRCSPATPRTRNNYSWPQMDLCSAARKWERTAFQRNELHTMQ